MSVDIQIHREDSVMIVALSGAVDVTTTPRIQETLLDQLSPENCQIVIDMNNVEFISSAALRMMLQVMRQARSFGGDLRLARLQPDVKTVVDMIFASMVQTFGSLPGALASYGETRGTGKRQRWTDDLLDKMRGLGDPLADEAVAALFQEGQITAVNRLLSQLVSNDYVPPVDLPVVVHDYLESTMTLPSWADSSRIRGAQAISGRYGIQIVTALFCASLPVAYACRKGVHVLAMTNRLSKQPYRRIMETAQMILDMMAPGGMEPDGLALRTIQKVRLMHAAIRYLLLASGEWDTAAYDHPINQEDMVGTLLTFSHTVTHSLPLLGIQLSDQEREDYHHLWRVVGYMIGVIPELLSDTVQGDATLMEKILSRQLDASTDGRELTVHLVNMMQEHLPGKHYNHIPQALIRHLVGDEISDMLDIQSTNWRFALKPMRWANAMLDQSDNHIPIIGKAAEVLTRRLLVTFTTSELEGKRTAFRIPDSLKDDWQVHPHAISDNED